MIGVGKHIGRASDNNNSGAWVQGLLENEYVGTSFAVGAIRTIPGVQAVGGSYDISSSANAKWVNLLVLFVTAVGYRVVLYVLLRLNVRKHMRLLGSWCCWSWTPQSDYYSSN